MASSLKPNEGTAQEWITSAAVVWTRTTLPTGTTSSLSTASSLTWPGLMSLVSSMFESNLKPPWSAGYSYSQYQAWPTALRTTSAFGIINCARSSRKEGIAIATRMRTGTMVQATSSMVLWVVREGLGFACSLNLTMIVTSRARTNSEIAVIIQTSQVWKRWAPRARSVTGFC